MPSRQRSFRVEAIVLRHQDWGEADRLLVLFTRQAGKLRAVAKGVRKLRSRKAGHLEPFTRVSLQLAKGRDMPIVTQAEALDLYMPLREDLDLYAYGSYAVELLDRFTYEEGENSAMFRLLRDTLERLARGEDVAFSLRYYEIRILDLLGYRPQLFHCAACQEEIKAEDQYFSCELGGVLCPQCGKKTQGVMPVSLNALKYLRHLQRSSYLEATRANISPAVNAEMESLLQAYITYLLERKLNTPGFLRNIRAKNNS
jgi:DNA repair protein RecO (recombination protein O)